VTPSKAFSPSASASWFVVDDGFDDDPAAVAGLFTHPDAGEHACDDLPHLDQRHAPVLLRHGGNERALLLPLGDHAEHGT
jgi:hypothetical protein